MIKFVIFFFLSVFLGCLDKAESPVSLSVNSFQGDYGADIEMNYYFKGVLEFKLTASSVEQLSEPIEMNIFSEGIHVVIYDNTLDTIATIFSDFAVQNKQEKLIEVSKNVILTNLNQEKLSTEKLFWNRDDQTIYTDDFVTINRKNEIIMGYGFVSDETFSTYSLSNITGTIYL